MTPFAAGLLEAKRQGEANAPKIPVTIYKAGETFEIGPFKIEAIPVSHSIPEPMSLAITTPLGTVVHTGDWKLDPAPEIGPMTDEARFRALGDAGVLALICNSTNALREGESPSEQAVGVGLRGVIEKAPGRVAVTTFSSNVGRVRSIAEAARDTGRQVLVLGRSLKRMISVAGELGYMEGIPAFIAEEDYGFIPRENLVDHLHRQPGRIARRTRQAGARRDEDGRAVAGRHRRLLLAHHPRQREGDPRDQEPAHRPGHQDHRGRRRAGPRVGPPAPQRAAQDV